MRSSKYGRSVPDFDPPPLRPVAPPPSRFPVVLGVLAAVTLALLVLTMLDRWDNTLELDQQRYCELVALHKKDPDLGWPDFQGTFASECNDDGTVRKGQ